MSTKPIISTVLALAHYPNKESYALSDLDVMTEIVNIGNKAYR